MTFAGDDLVIIEAVAGTWQCCKKRSHDRKLARASLQHLRERNVPYVFWSEPGMNCPIHVAYALDGSNLQFHLHLVHNPVRINHNRNAQA